MEGASSNYFNQLMPLKDELKQATRVAVEGVLNVTPGERVLIIANPHENIFNLSLSLYDAVLQQGGSPSLIYQPVKTELNFTEETVTGAISANPDVIISISKARLGKDKKAIVRPYAYDGKIYDSTYYYLLYGRKSIRGFWSPGITEELFVRTVTIDYERLKKECRYIKALLDQAVSVRVTSAAGTDITFGVRERTTYTDDGDFSHPGRGGNLPAGEAFISPQLKTAFGQIVFEGSMGLYNGSALLDKPVLVKVENGFVSHVEGSGGAEQLRESIRLSEENASDFEREGLLSKELSDFYVQNSRNIGEFGIGLNPKAEIVGNTITDEKVSGTCHFAIGYNFDEDAPALIHLDGLVKKPDVRVIMADGKEEELVVRGELCLYKP